MFPAVREGSFMALFQDESDPSQTCWGAFNMLRDYYPNMTPIRDLRVRNFAQSMKVYFEYQILIVYFYQVCKLDQVNINMGRRLNSPSGFVSLIINSIFRYIFQFGDPEWQA